MKNIYYADLMKPGYNGKFGKLEKLIDGNFYSRCIDRKGIYVEETLNPEVFKEIVTGKKFRLAENKNSMEYNFLKKYPVCVNLNFILSDSIDGLYKIKEYIDQDKEKLENDIEEFVKIAIEERDRHFVENKDTLPLTNREIIMYSKEIEEDKKR